MWSVWSGTYRRREAGQYRAGILSTTVPGQCRAETGSCRCDVVMTLSHCWLDVVFGAGVAYLLVELDVETSRSIITVVYGTGYLSLNDMQAASWNRMPGVEMRKKPEVRIEVKSPTSVQLADKKRNLICNQGPAFLLLSLHLEFVEKLPGYIKGDQQQRQVVDLIF